MPFKVGDEPTFVFTEEVSDSEWEQFDGEIVVIKEIVSGELFNVEFSDLRIEMVSDAELVE